MNTRFRTARYTNFSLWATWCPCVQPFEEFTVVRKMSSPSFLFSDEARLQRFCSRSRNKINYELRYFCFWGWYYLILNIWLYSLLCWNFCVEEWTRSLSLDIKLFYWSLSALNVGRLSVKKTRNFWIFLFITFKYSYYFFFFFLEIMRAF